jgi:hypothetical protein
MKKMVLLFLPCIFGIGCVSRQMDEFEMISTNYRWTRTEIYDDKTGQLLQEILPGNDVVDFIFHYELQADKNWLEIRKNNDGLFYTEFQPRANNGPEWYTRFLGLTLANDTVQGNAQMLFSSGIVIYQLSLMDWSTVLISGSVGSSFGSGFDSELPSIEYELPYATELIYLTKLD